MDSPRPSPGDPDHVRRLEEQVATLGERLDALRREQAMWVRVEKEAAIGRLARGLAHEINNPLQGVLGFVQLMIQQARAGTLEPSAIEEKLAQVESSALRCKRIVDAVLDFAGRGEGEAMHLDLVGLLELNLVLLRAELEAKDASLDYDTPGAPVVVRGEPAPLAQALFNVLANARDAVPSGGRVAVAVTVDGLDARIAIRDDGPGIPAEDLERIFDPFFTTKAVGEGTGLGLCAARGILRLHGGDLLVESPTGGGATVTLVVPRAPTDD